MSKLITAQLANIFIYLISGEIKTERIEFVFSFNPHQFGGVICSVTVEPAHPSFPVRSSDTHPPHPTLAAELCRFNGVFGPTGVTELALHSAIANFICAIHVIPGSLTKMRN